MAFFEYKGLSAKGKTVTGTIEADNPGDLRVRLLKDGVYLTQHVTVTSLASEGRISKMGGSFLSREVNVKGWFERVRPQDVSVMTRQFSTLLHAGVPMTEALSAMVEQQERPKLKHVVATLRQKVVEGISLADALAEHPKVFPPLYVNMIRVGEASGTLDIVLERLADFLESSVRLKSKVISAMVYPVLMLCVAVLIIGIMMVVVIPRMTEMFAELGGDLPLVTKILIFVSKVVSNTWFIVIPLLYLAYWRFRKWTTTPIGRHRWDAFKLKAAIFGRVVRLIAVARFARTLATLLSSGVPVLNSLEIVKSIVNNAVLEDAIDAAKISVREGESLAAPLQRSGEFPPMMTHMIAIGERTGQLESMLGNVADTYDSEVESKVATMTAILEPVMIVGMGLMVAFLVFAIMMPMLKMNEVITGGQ